MKFNDYTFAPWKRLYFSAPQRYGISHPGAYAVARVQLGDPFPAKLEDADLWYVGESETSVGQRLSRYDSALWKCFTTNKVGAHAGAKHSYQKTQNLFLDYRILAGELVYTTCKIDDFAPGETLDLERDILKAYVKKHGRRPIGNTR